MHHAFYTFFCCHCTSTTWKYFKNFTFCGRRVHKTTNFLSFPELRYSLLEFNSRENCQHLTKWATWNTRDKVEAASFLSDVFVASPWSSFWSVWLRTRFYGHVNNLTSLISELKRKLNVYLHKQLYVPVTWDDWKLPFRGKWEKVPFLQCLMKHYLFLILAWSLEKGRTPNKRP